MKLGELKELYRYNKNSKEFIIDIQLDYYRDVYSEWDYSPLANRDLDEDLIDYIMSCSYEIPLKYKIKISFHLPLKLKNESRERRSIIGIQNFFQYKIRKIKFEKVSLIRSTLIYLLLGTVLLLGAYMIQSIITNNFLSHIIPEGLLIGAWVLIWEIFSILFFQINKLSRTINHYRRLVHSPIEYQYKE